MIRAWGSLILPGLAAVGALSLAAETAADGAFVPAAIGYGAGVGCSWVAWRRARRAAARTRLLRTRRRVWRAARSLRRTGWTLRRPHGSCDRFVLTPDGVLGFAIAATEPTEAALDRLEDSAALLARAGRPVLAVCVWVGLAEALDGRVLCCGPSDLTYLLSEAHNGFLAACATENGGGLSADAHGALGRDPALAGQLFSPECGRREAAWTASSLTDNAGEPARQKEHR